MRWQFVREIGYGTDSWGKAWHDTDNACPGASRVTALLTARHTRWDPEQAHRRTLQPLRLACSPQQCISFFFFALSLVHLLPFLPPVLSTHQSVYPSILPVSTPLSIWPSVKCKYLSVKKFDPTAVSIPNNVFPITVYLWHWRLLISVSFRLPAELSRTYHSPVWHTALSATYFNFISIHIDLTGSVSDVNCRP
jgi:hypothetical protein